MIKRRSVSANSEVALHSVALNRLNKFNVALVLRLVLRLPRACVRCHRPAVSGGDEELTVLTDRDPPCRHPMLHAAAVAAARRTSTRTTSKSGPAPRRSLPARTCTCFIVLGGARGGQVTIMYPRFQMRTSRTAVWVGREEVRSVPSTLKIIAHRCFFYGVQHPGGWGVVKTIALDTCHEIWLHIHMYDCDHRHIFKR